MRTDWIQTFTGKKFFPLEPNVDDICIEDIAHSLSMQCRFNGHCKNFYSVAQHSAIMSAWWFSDNSELAKFALLHDASEAYLSDLPKPLKHLPAFHFYREAEQILQDLIYAKFGLSIFEPDEIKKADWEILCDEAQSPFLMSPLHPDWSAPDGRNLKIHPLNPVEAKKLFLDQFTELFK